MLFFLYDLDGDGFISFDELFYYLRSIFRILKACEPSKYTNIDVDDLAVDTAKQIMKEADTSGDNLISLEEFLAWTNGEAPINTTPAMKKAGVSDISHARSILGLENVSAEELFDHLARRADKNGEISKQDFRAVLREYAQATGDLGKADKLIDVLFKTLDLNGNGRLDFSEVASGMSVLVGGDKLTKLKIAGQLFDLDGDGLITRDEMLTYLTSVFSVVLATQPEARARVGNITAEQLAQATCDEAFEVADLNHDGVLDFNEFVAWVLGDSRGAATQRIMDMTPSELGLQEIRKITGLERLYPDEVFSALASEANEHGELDRRAFNSAFQKFARTHVSSSESSNLRVVVNRIFDLFDTDGNGFVSFPELAAGLSVLCNGSKAEKTRAAFRAYGDSDSLTREEVTGLLLSVFRVLLETVPGAKERVGVSAEELAEATAAQCFFGERSEQYRIRVGRRLS